MDLLKSINYLLENAGPIIQYRLRKEILKNISPSEEEYWVEQIYGTSNFRLIEKYVKTTGIIGGLSIMDKDKHTRLQDCEAAARLLSNYAIAKKHPLVVNFITALRDDDVLREEMQPLKHDGGFEGRFDSINNGNAMMSVIYNIQAMLGYGDDFDDLIDYQKICLKGFRRILDASSFEEIVKRNPKIRNNAPYIESDDYFPNMYTLSMLAHTRKWRSEENIKMLTNFLTTLIKSLQSAA